MAKDPEIFAHQEWLGYVQPVGLVVSIPALLSARAYINRNFAPDHRRFLEALPSDKDGEPIAEIRDFPAFAKSVLGWATDDLCGAPGAPAIPASLEVALPEYSETLRPTYALRDFEPSDPAHEFLMLIQEFQLGTDLDAPMATDAHHWQASSQAKFERLLRQSGIPIGLLVNGRQIRLVYAPEKELSGHITFNIGDMVTVAGRPICGAMMMLLCSERLYTGAPEERLLAILANSRKYQNVVSTQLAEQVLEALYELLRGFQAADDQARGDMLRNVLAREPDHVYHGLLTVLLRLVFLLFAEDRGLLSTDPLYTNHYSVTGLYERLREDNGRYADLMDQRFGAWAQLLVLFRLIYSGGSHGGMKIPSREGYLFDPDRYLFLEGRQEKKDKPIIPRVSDGVIFRVLSKLLLLDGERLSYRTLAVEQIGSVYQAIMGFSLQVATGRSIAIKPPKRHGAPATINLETLLATAPDKRLKQFTDETDQKLTGQAADTLKSATTVEELLAALERKIATSVTPMPVPKGAMVFQPSDERRKSGSHYTPSSLTGPIVEAALQPVLKQLGPNPTPAQILTLKICDLAMGSAAFLVETCRQLGDALVKAWHAHNEGPSIPPDEDETLYAQRLIAQRCLYGLDKNPMAADLAKLSLWLATLAKDHPFTFLDHSLRHGDALVGLTTKQIASFNWVPSKQRPLFEENIPRQVERASEYRRRILDARDGMSYAQLAQHLAVADDALSLPRMIADAVVAAFFMTDKPKTREDGRKQLQSIIEADLKTHGLIPVDGEVDSRVRNLRLGPKGIPSFHWELEFPEVFMKRDGQRTGGFDSIIGNPPFLGGTLIGGRLGLLYHDFLVERFPPATGLADLISFFLRRSFDLIRDGGTLGLIATNTVAQGDTRKVGLEWIVQNGGTIFQAQRRHPWPGEASVVVSVLHLQKAESRGSAVLNGKLVKRISAYLLVGDVDSSPANLQANKGICYRGTKVWGSGFVFEDPPSNGSSSIAEMESLVSRNPHNRDVIFAYLGGEDFNSSPTQAPSRFVIDFGTRSEEEAREWPQLFSIVEERVRPVRLNNKQRNYRDNWWLHANRVEEAGPYLHEHGRILALTCVAHHLTLAFVSRGTIIQDRMMLFLLHEYGDFALLQSRVHEVWVRMVGTTLLDALSYTTTCFDTFPRSFDKGMRLSESGKCYYDFRAQLMIRNNEGLTKTYNRFHDPAETQPDILRLRELHDLIDREVLDAYGWADIQPKCAFLPEFDDESSDEDDTGRSGKKKYRYRWPDEVRDEVLARLLELNRQRALQEGHLVMGSADTASRTENGRKKKRAADSAPPTSGPLFAGHKGDD